MGYEWRALAAGLDEWNRDPTTGQPFPTEAKATEDAIRNGWRGKFDVRATPGLPNPCPNCGS